MSKLKPPRAGQVQKNGGSMYPISAVQAALSPRSGAGKQASEREVELKAAVERLQKSGILRVQGADKVAFYGKLLGLGARMASGASKLRQTGAAIGSAAAPATTSAIKSAPQVAGSAAGAGSAASQAATATSRTGARHLVDRFGWGDAKRALTGAGYGVGVDTIGGMLDTDTGGMGMLVGGVGGALGGRRGSQFLRNLLPAAYDRRVISGGQRLGGLLRDAKPTLATAGTVGVLGDIQSELSDGAINVARPFDMLRNSQSRLVQLAQSPEAAEFLTSKLTDQLRDKLSPSGDTIQRLLASLGRGARATREGLARGYHGGQRYIFE